MSKRENDLFREECFKRETPLREVVRVAANGDVADDLPWTRVYDERPVLADTEAVAALRHIITTLYALPFGNPVPRRLVEAINRGEDFLQKYSPVPF
ncbi:MAG: hypothetical protein IPO00_08750 [Betaproteobacteria bacterium]|nr:hypothetical protein [Betaproteobacteria bacterium]